MAIMFNEHVNFFKTTGIKQQIDTFARRQLATRMLRLNVFFAPAQSRDATAFFQLFNNISHNVLPRES
jgi:hypothetical protein